MRVRATPNEVQAELARRSLRAFVDVAWPMIEPGTQLVQGFHIDAICAQLEAVARGETRRLLINIPPRHGKSLLVSVIFPAWLWISSPQVRWLFASYSQSLSTRDSVRCRRLIESTLYQERWGGRYRLPQTRTRRSGSRTTAAGRGWQPAWAAPPPARAATSSESTIP